MNTSQPLTFTRHWPCPELFRALSGNRHASSSQQPCEARHQSALVRTTGGCEGGFSCACPQQPSSWFSRRSLDPLADLQPHPELMPAQLPLLIPRPTLNSPRAPRWQNLTGPHGQRGWAVSLWLCPYGAGENLEGSVLLKAGTRCPGFWGTAVVSICTERRLSHREANSLVICAKL